MSFFTPPPPGWILGNIPQPGDPPQVQVRAYLPTNMDDLNLVALLTGVATVLRDDLIVVDYGDGDTTMLVGKFDYAAPGLLTGGTLERIQETDAGLLQFDLEPISVPVDQFLALVSEGDADTAFAFLLQGADLFSGSAGADLFRAYGGNDEVFAVGGDDTVFGGSGADTIDGGEGENYLRGETGDDVVRGGSLHDDMHGNQGADTLYGRAGADWVLGGQGNDVLFGEGSDDFVQGNLGSDTADGGDGDDVVRGGQGNDLLSGGNGHDTLSGDLGTDVLTGGLGGDTFYFFAGGGVDRVNDFNYADGDRVLLAPGTTWSVERLGIDTIVRVGLFDQLVLVGVDATGLPSDWIVA